MDKSIPAGAAVLLRFIYQTEVGREAPECYEVIYGHNEDKLSRPITTMTVNEILTAQTGWSKRFRSSATGAYQFMQATLRGLVKELHLTGSEVFTANLQDRLGYHLLKRRGYLDYASGKISRTEFGKRLAQEWASFPVLYPVQGAKRAVARGQSYYAGDGLNKALVKPETVEAILNQVKALGLRAQDQVVEQKPLIVDAVAPKANPSSGSSMKAAIIASVGAALSAAVVSGWTWFYDLPCSMFNIFCGG